MTDRYLDNLATKLIRLREKNICQCCGKYVEGENSHCSHIRPRSHKNTRWLPQNLLHLCFVCHRCFTDDPGHFKEWILSVIGAEQYEELIYLSNQIWDKDRKKWERILKKEIESI